MTSAIDDRADAGADQHLPPVHPVRQPAERELDQRPAEHRAGHQKRDARDGQADLLRIDRAERAEGAVDHADQDAADHRHRRVPVEPADIEPRRLERLRMLGGGERRRQEREAIEDGADREEEERVRRGDDHQELPGGRTGEHHHLVDREDRPAVLLRGPLVEPGFDDHRRPGEAEAGQAAKRDPRLGRDDEEVEEDADRRDRGHHPVASDMADPLHHRRHQRGTRRGSRPTTRCRSGRARPW